MNRGKVRPSEEKSKRLKELLGPEGEGVFRDFIKVGMEKLLQEALEGEVTEFLGREWYQRNGDDKEFNGYRNGYYDRKIKTTGGTLEVKAPRVRDSEEEFESQILERIEYLEKEVKKLTMEMYGVNP